MDTKRKLGVMKEIEAANKRHVEEWKREQAGRKDHGCSGGRDDRDCGQSDC